MSDPSIKTYSTISTLDSKPSSRINFNSKPLPKLAPMQSYSRHLNFSISITMASYPKTTFSRQ